MKKLFAFLLIILYSVTSFGMTLHLHYCCGKLDKVTLSPKAERGCKVKTVIHNTGCCKSKQYELKIKLDQEAGAKQITSFAAEPLIPFPAYSAAIFVQHKLPVNFLSTGPPVINATIPLFIQYCVYRI